MIRITGLTRKGKAAIWVRLFSDGRTLTKHRGGVDARFVYYDLPSGTTKTETWQEVDRDIRKAIRAGDIKDQTILRLCRKAVKKV